MAKKITWNPKLIENVRNEEFTNDDFNFLVGELSEYFYSEMLRAKIGEENPEINIQKVSEIKSRVDD